MQQTPDINRVALEALRNRITKILPAQIRPCIAELSEEQLWWRPNEKANSVGNLVLHVSGSLRHYLSRGIGGMAYDRNRPAEFAERGPLPKEELLSIFDETIRQAEATLDSFDTSHFTEETEDPRYVKTNFDLILNIAIHLSTHTGQIVYVTKMLKEGALDELWTRSHRSA